MKKVLKVLKEKENYQPVRSTKIVYTSVFKNKPFTVSKHQTMEQILSELFI